MPGGLSAYVAVFRNWSGEIAIDATWRVSVSSADQVAALANWAAGAGWKLRASGYSHNWSPLVIDPVRSDPASVLLVDPRTGLAQVSVDAVAK